MSQMENAVTALDMAILGGGAAGMMAAVAAGEIADGRMRIGLFEKNARPGIKVLVCGGGRCNFTNAGTIDFLIEQFGRNGRFLTPALRHLDNEALREFFAGLGVPSHEEHDGKIYPDSNQATSVVDALVKRMSALGVEIHCGSHGTVATLLHEEMHPSHPFALTTVDGTMYRARTVLLAVGGMSYQKMGTTGDGYRFAEGERLGTHAIITPRPAIVGLLVKEEWPRSISGLAVRDIEVRIIVDGPLPTLTTGRPVPSVNDLLFTHFGLSGPAILNPSEIVAELLEKMDGVTLRIDFSRHHTHEELHAVLREWQQLHGKKLLRKLLASSAPEIVIRGTSPDQSWADMPARMTGKETGTLAGAFSLPTRLVEKIMELENIPPEQLCATLTSAQMHRLVERVKNTRVTAHGTRGFKEAMVTAGGISLRDVDPKTMQSKKVPGLYLAGEVLDLTGPSGGYNLQLAFSTGHLAGTSMANGLLSR